jgi:signal transduction histidine kinase
MLTVARLAALTALIWSAVHERRPRGVQPNTPVEALLLVGAGIGWVAWMVSRRMWRSGPSIWASLAVMGAAGGAVAGYAPIAITFLGVAGLGSGIAFDAVPAIGVSVVGVSALAVTTLVLGSPHVFIAEGAASAVIGQMVGASRRQYVERTFQAEQLLAERIRADAERDRAAALAERNRVGREVHDVLAHSLGALSVQLDAADALLENGDESDRARTLIQQARRLAVQGLEDTRQAVQALRDEPVELAEQLSTLASRDNALMTVSGVPRTLPAEAGLALFRAAQEAVTNARKHAPGAPVSINLEFHPHSTTLTVTNGQSPDGVEHSALERSGGGFGLQGMRERIELLGGRIVAEPHELGWMVQAAVPE